MADLDYLPKGDYRREAEQVKEQDGERKACAICNQKPKHKHDLNAPATSTNWLTVSAT